MEQRTVVEMYRQGASQVWDETPWPVEAPHEALARFWKAWVERHARLLARAPLREAWLPPEPPLWFETQCQELTPARERMFSGVLQLRLGPRTTQPLAHALSRHDCLFLEALESIKKAWLVEARRLQHARHTLRHYGWGAGTHLGGLP